MPHSKIILEKNSYKKLNRHELEKIYSWLFNITGLKVHIKRNNAFRVDRVNQEGNCYLSSRIS